MIVRIASGISGFDELTSSEDNLALKLGGFPENSATLIYGPPEVGKSTFCYQFTYQGLTQDEPCLYLTTDHGIQDIYDTMKGIGLNLDDYLENEMLYVVDAVSSDMEVEESDIYQRSSVHNPTDMLVKVSRVARSISQKSPRLRGVVDSVTTILESNNEMLIVRVLKTYILRIKEAGGTVIITYIEGSADSRTETLIKSMVDNIIKLDGEKIIIEAMKGMGRKEDAYRTTDEGIVILHDEQ
ncbi:MAG: RAD55 family ATPase [Methanobacterium sp.]|jgi:KaiC/GvpD/RAD55 family RecA-like ATPase|nr:RAD55 family ATPase [Methanobacterium sp.]